MGKTAEQHETIDFLFHEPSIKGTVGVVVIVVVVTIIWHVDYAVKNLV